MAATTIDVIHTLARRSTDTQTHMRHGVATIETGMAAAVVDVAKILTLGETWVVAADLDRQVVDTPAVVTTTTRRSQTR